MINQTNNVFAFCPPPPGKPDTNLPIDFETHQPRKRVIQVQQDGVYSDRALKFMRMRIGKHPPKELEEARSIEILFSRQRKLHIENDKQCVTAFAQTLAFKRGKVDKKIAHEVIQLNQGKNQSRLKKEFDALEDFCNQNEYEDFCTFASVLHLNKKLKLYEEFFRDLNVSPFEYLEKNLAYIQLKWQDLSLEEKVGVHAGLFFAVAYTKYGLKKSPWTPDQPIDQLIEQLNLYGPHLVTGKLGRLYYRVRPFKLAQKIAGRSILRWKPNAEREPLSIWSHTVLIVGARRDTKEVYYIDPSEASNPNNIESQKVYVISYDELKENIYTLEGIDKREIKTDRLPLSYALYGDPKMSCL